MLNRRGKSCLLSLGSVVALLTLGGCATTRTTQPSETATEQLLISTAVAHAVSHLNLRMAPGTKVFVNTKYFHAPMYSGYAIASVRSRLLDLGARLVESPKKADMIVELRSGAQSINHNDFLVGLPSTPIPIPLAGTVTTPKIALFEENQQKGIAKIGIATYGKKGQLVASTKPLYGTSHDTNWVALLAISWTTQNILPKSAHK